MTLKARIRLEIEIEIELEFNQLEKEKSISSLVKFALIDQNLIQSQFQSIVWYRLNSKYRNALVASCKTRIRLKIKIEIELEFDQSKQSSLNLKLIFFLLIG